MTNDIGQYSSDRNSNKKNFTPISKIRGNIGSMIADRCKTRSATRYTWHECRLRSGWTQRNILTLRRDLARLPNTSILLFSPLCRNLHIFGECSVLEDRVCNPTGVIGFGLIQYSFALPPYILALFQPDRHRFCALHFFFFPRQQRVAKLICCSFCDQQPLFFQYTIYKVCEFCASFFFFFIFRI